MIFLDTGRRHTRLRICHICPNLFLKKNFLYEKTHLPLSLPEKKKALLEDKKKLLKPILFFYISNERFDCFTVFFILFYI